MVKIGAPLMSMSASGKIGQRLVFSQRKSGQQARFQKAQKDVVTSKRTVQRDLYKIAISAWNDFTNSEKNVYVLRAKSLNLKMTGYNLFVKENISAPPVPVYFTISASSGSNGSIDPVGDVSVLQGENQNFVFSANQYYAISAVLVDGVNIGTPSSYLFTDVQADHTISVSYALIYDLDAWAFFNALGLANLSTAQKGYVDTLVLALKSANVWAKMYAIYPIIGGTAFAHKFNLKDPRDLDVAYRLTFIATVTHNSTGMYSNGTTGQYDTYLNDNTVMQQNDFSIWVYLRTNTGIVNVNAVGVASTTNSVSFNPRNNFDNFGSRAHTTNAHSLANLDSRGFFGISRLLSTGYKKYKNATETAVTEASTGKQNLTYLGMYLTGTVRDTREQAFVALGKGLTTAEEIAFYNAVQAYQTSLGRQV